MERIRITVDVKTGPPSFLSVDLSWGRVGPLVERAHRVPQVFWRKMLVTERHARVAMAEEGHDLKVAWWPETLFFVPDVRDAEALWRDGVSRERVWTAKEILVLLSGPLPAAEDLRVIMIARREFAGEVVEARPRRD